MQRKIDSMKLDVVLCGLSVLLNFKIVLQGVREICREEADNFPK